MHNTDSRELYRLDTLRSYRILDTSPEVSFDRLTRLAARNCDTPIAAVTFVDEARLWFKSVIGMDFRETDRAGAFCSHAICGTTIYIVADARSSPLFASNPLVTGKPGIGFYAGVPLITADGAVLGTLAVMDHVPRSLEADQIDALETLAEQVMAQLELRRRHPQEKRNLGPEQRNFSLMQIASRVTRTGGWEITLPDYRVSWSDEVCDLHEVPRGTTPTIQKVVEFYEPESRKSIIEAFKTCVREGVPYDEELQIVTGSGRRVWTRTVGHAVRNATGAIIGVHGAIQDITDRKIAETALAQSEQRFQHLADAMPQIVWMADANGVVDFGNRTVSAYTGLEQIDPEAMNWLNILHPEDVEPTLNAWAEAVATGNLFSTEYRLIRAIDQTYRWHMVSGMPIRDESGHIVRWYGTCTDIHDAKLATDEIGRLATQLTTTLESITEGFFTLDRHLRFTYINKAAERLLRRTRTELLGKVIWKAYPGLKDEDLESRYLAAVEQRAAVEFNYFYSPLNRWYGVRAYPSQDGISVYFRDTTERRRAQLFKVEQTAILERIAVGAASAEILEAITRMAESQDPSCFCSIMLTTADRQHLIVGAGPTLPPAFRQAIEGLKIGPAVGSCGTAVFERRLIITSDVESDTRWCGWRDLARHYGIRACWSQPILSSTGDVLGTFAVYSPTPRSPEQAEVEMLASCAHIVSIVLEREQAAGRARENEEHLHLRTRAIEACANPIAIVRAEAPHYPVEYVNRTFERVTGYAAEEILGSSLRTLLRDDLDQPGLLEIGAARDQQREGHAVVRGYRRDGTLFWIDVYVSPVHNEAGEVTHFVAAMYDVTAAKRYEAELEYQSNYDTLTGLANRNLLRDRANQAIARAGSAGQQIWMVCINLDRFKFVNDTLGHEAGDVLLQLVALRVQAALLPTDTAARIAGDEFVLVLTEAVDEHTVTTTIKRIMDAIAYPLTVEGHDYFLTCSAGIAVYPSDGSTAESLIKYADIALYRAKEMGRNNFQFYTAAMNDRAMDRLRLEGDLRHALQRNELVLYYQPQVEVRTGRIAGVEALLRWKHPQLGLVPPERFIRIAEETGLIVPIGAWVMQAACRQNKEWQNAGLGTVRIAVNLSGNQFYQQDLVQSVESILRETGLEADCLDIELTESLVMTDVAHALDIMHGLKRLGVKLSMDDFGTGYSSLSYLKRFPIDVLKIDRSFVHNIIDDPDEAAIARSIITLAHSLRLQVIAEGVETEEQLGYLRRHRCDQIQGYYFSRPVPAEEFEQLLREGKRLPDVPDTVGQQQTLLILDDDQNITSALHRLLRRDGYHILRAHTPAEAFGLLAVHDIQVVLCDQRMPLMTGTQFLSRVKELYPDTIRMMLSGYTGVDSIIEATNSGAVFRFHTKPWDDEMLRTSITEAFRYHWLMHGETAEK